MEYDNLHPEDTQAKTETVVCPCCGRETVGPVCLACGYPDLQTPDKGERYALVAFRAVGNGAKKEEIVQTARYLSRFCGLGDTVTDRIINTVYYTSARHPWAGRAVLRRNVPAAAALWMAEKRPANGLSLHIVEDRGETEDELLRKREAMPLPSQVEMPGKAKENRPLSFWEVVGAVVVGNLLVQLGLWLLAALLF